MRIQAGPGKLLGQLLAQRWPDVMFNPFRGFMQMVERQVEMLTEIRFPQAVRTDQRAGGFTAALRKTHPRRKPSGRFTVKPQFAVKP